MKKKTVNKYNRVAEQVKELAVPLCNSEQFEFVHAECVSDRGTTVVRLYVDKPGGITIDDCVYLNRELGDLMDVHLEGIEAYRLEVSSHQAPNRPLTKPDDFQRFKGQMVRVETVQPIDGRKRFKGLLGGMMDKNIILTLDQSRVEIPYDQIGKARLV